MEGEITIRSFSPPDQVHAQELILTGLAEHFNTINPKLNRDLEDIQENYIWPGSLFLVAELEGELVGTGGLIAETEVSARIVRVSVSGSHRRLGIGRLITEHLINSARDYGYSQVVVETNDDWYDAIRLYQRHGFVEYDRSSGEIHMILRL